MNTTIGCGYVLTSFQPTLFLQNHTCRLTSLLFVEWIAHIPYDTVTAQNVLPKNCPADRLWQPNLARNLIWLPYLVLPDRMRLPYSVPPCNIMSARGPNIASILCLEGPNMAAIFGPGPNVATTFGPRRNVSNLKI